MIARKRKMILFNYPVSMLEITEQRKSATRKQISLKYGIGKNIVWKKDKLLSLAPSSVNSTK